MGGLQHFGLFLPKDVNCFRQKQMLWILDEISLFNPALTSRSCCTDRIQIRVLTNCQAISTEIGTDSLKL